MASPLSGPGIGLPLPQNLYPSELSGAPYDSSNSRVALAPGESLPIPAGDWYIHLGKYLISQYLDPITGIWSMGSAAGWVGGTDFVKSDGFNYRIANMLGCPMNATVAALGSAYVQGTTTIAPTPGNSTWLPIVGGALALSGATLVSNGAGYGVAPIVLIPPPPPAQTNPNGVGGVPASGFCTIASGTVSGFTFTNPGAGYPTAPTALVVPSPFDPNLSVGITAATLAFTLTGSGQIRSALCTNQGAPLSNPNQFTLTITGAGSNGSLTGNVLQTVTAVSVIGAGLGYGTISALVTSVGGVPSTGSIVDPFSLGLAWRPRPLQAGLTVGAIGTLAAQVGTIYDGGLFLGSSAPGAVIITNPAPGANVTVSGATLALTMGGTQDIATFQPAP